MINYQIINKMDDEKNKQTDEHSERDAGQHVAGIMFAEIDAGIAHQDGPEEGNDREERGVDGEFGTGREGGVAEADGCLVAAEAQEGGQRKDIGGMGGGKAVRAAAVGAEHVHALERMAGAGSAEDILEDVGEAVGKKEAEGDAEEDEPPPLGFVAERGDAEEEHQQDGPAPMLAEEPKEPVEKGAVVLVDPIKDIGIEILNHFHGIRGIKDLGCLACGKSYL